MLACVSSVQALDNTPILTLKESNMSLRTSLTASSSHADAASSPLLSSVLILGAVLGCLMLPSAAHAADQRNGNHDNGWHGQQQHQQQPRANDRHDGNRGKVVVQRRPVYTYYPQQYYRPQPQRVIYPVPRPQPILAPAYTYYRGPIVGDRMLVYTPVPEYVRVRLQPAPRGYYYTVYGDHVYLVRQNDNIIAQIISELLG